MNPTRTRVIGYIRVSTEAQADGGVFLDAQRAKLSAYAAALDLDLVAVVEGKGGADRRKASSAKRAHPVTTPFP